MNKKVKKIITAFYWVIIVIVLVVALLLLLSSGKAPINYRAYSVESGSMEPVLPLGSVVVTFPQASYQEDDIVTFRSEASAKQTITHRIVSIEKDEDIGKIVYQTKGDANEDPDLEKVDDWRVLGKVVLNIPLLGYVVSFAKTQTGFIALIVIPATLIIYSEVSSIAGEVRKMFAKKEVEVETKETKEEKTKKVKKKTKKKNKKKS